MGHFRAKSIYLCSAYSPDYKKYFGLEKFQEKFFEIFCRKFDPPTKSCNLATFPDLEKFPKVAVKNCAKFPKKNPKIAQKLRKIALFAEKSPKLQKLRKIALKLRSAIPPLEHTNEQEQPHVLVQVMFQAKHSFR